MASKDPAPPPCVPFRTAPAVQGCRLERDHPTPVSYRLGLMSPNASGGSYLPVDPRPNPVISEAVSRIDASGRFLTDDLPRLREVVGALRSGQEPLDHPASLFGPWREMGPRARAAIRRTVETDIRGTMDFYPQGEFWTGLVRGGWEWDRFLHDRSACPRFRTHLIRWNNRLSGGPLNARNHLYRTVHRWRWNRGIRVEPADMLAALGRTPQWLLGDFAEGVHVDPRARGYWVNEARKVTYGYMVGLDLMPTPQGICCLEANLQSGIYDDQRKVLGGNPFLEGILEAARAHGARRVLWLEGHHGELRTWMVTESQQLERAEDFPFEILEHPCMPSRRSLPSGVSPPNRWRLDPWVPDRSLLVRRNEFPVGSDFVINHKESFIRALGAALEKENQTRVYVPPMTRVPLHVPEPQGPGLPNLVYKYPESMAGAGVFFLRARNTEHALALARELDRRHQEPPGLFQPFLCSLLLEGRRVCDVRAEIFISPLGTWYLSSFKREAARSVPECIPEGLVSERGVFTSNNSTGGFLSRIGREEEEFRSAALTVGDALRKALEDTFRIRPQCSLPSASGPGTPYPGKEVLPDD